MSASTDPLRILTIRLGALTGPSHSGWYRGNHQGCRSVHRGRPSASLGVHLGRRRIYCFRCGLDADLDQMFPGLPKARRSRRGTPRWGSSHEDDPHALPWKPIQASGGLRTLEKPVVEYLSSRGIPRARAASLGLGYGTLPPYAYGSIHPWLRPDGTLGGWQARRIEDPEDGSPKIVHPKPHDWPNLYSPAKGGMFCFELLPRGSDVMLAEGPFDTYSGLRVLPTVGLMGSQLFDAQIRRLQSREPTRIFYGLDLDTHTGRVNPWTKKREVPKARAILSKLYRAFSVPILVVEFSRLPGDLGGRPDKTPHPRSVIQRLVARAEPWNPGD